MFKHLFKLIWNKKKQNFLLMSEILVSFMVIFAVMTLVVYYYQNYKKPIGVDSNDVWVVNYNNSYQTQNTDSLNLFYNTLLKVIKSVPQVKDVSFTSENIPFTNWTNAGSVMFNNRRVDMVDMYTVDDNYNNVLNLKLLEGRWFNKNDESTKFKPIVINSDLKENIFGNGIAVGNLIGDFENKHKMKIIGVVQSIKIKGDYSSTSNGLYQKLDTGSFRWVGTMLIKVIPNSNANFEGKLFKILSNYLKNSTVDIEHLTTKRSTINKFTLIPIIVMVIVASFLIVNVALGLFGVLWYNTNKRRGEIGLRRAIGATGKAISEQLVSEAMIMTTLSLILGTFLAIQFPLLNIFDLPSNVYLIALILALVFIYLIVFICSFYPGRQAALIYPAVALHED